MTDGSDALSTIPADDSGTDGWETALRTISLIFVGVVVLAGLVGIFGVRTGTAQSSGNGLTVSVEHASVTRAGLATPFSVAIATDDGTPLPKQITTRIDSAYLEMFDENGLEPEPASSYQNGQWTWWTFDVPQGHDELEVSFDVRLEPAVQWGRKGSATVEIDGDEKVTVEFATQVMP
jgi:hypothetical protein